MQGDKKNQNQEIRDYGCACGKKYLSYAAVYTHVRNKHGKKREFLDGIVRPVWKKTAKGRPKDQPFEFYDSQIKKINVLQIGLVQFEQLLLKGGQKRNILTEDNVVNFLKVENEANNIYLNYLRQQKNHKGPLEDRKININDLQPRMKIFYKDFCKHLQTLLSAKVLICLLFISKVIEGGQQQIEESIWGKVLGISDLLKKVFTEWSQIEQDEEFSEIALSTI